jgi:uncharacterized protein YcfJ
MQTMLKALLAAAAVMAATQAAAQVTFYEGEGFRGRAFSANRPISDLERFGFNDRASSVVVEHGRWQVCEHAHFEGQCVILRRGSYDSLAGMGMSNRISSVRSVSGNPRHAYEAPAPLPAPTYEWRQRPNERLYEVPVSSVHAVVGPPEQRCWVEREHVGGGGQGANIPGAIAGAVIGGIIGHQIGGGRGQDIATAGGAVAGAAIGAGVPGGPVYGRDVQRCASVPPGPPQFWDVTYNFRGVVHRVQMSAPPGPTIWVNGKGEPRG